MGISHKATSNRARAAIEVLVRTPDCEVDVPIVQLYRHVADSVREVPADEDAFGLCVCRDALDIEELAGVELDSRKEKDSSGRGVGVDRGKDVFCGDER